MLCVGLNGWCTCDLCVYHSAECEAYNFRWKTMIFSNHEFKTCDDCMSKIICHVQSIRWYQEECSSVLT